MKRWVEETVLKLMHLLGKIDRRRHGIGHEIHVWPKKESCGRQCYGNRTFLVCNRWETLVRKEKQAQDHALQMQQQTAKTRRWDLTSSITQKTCNRGPQK